MSNNNQGGFINYLNALGNITIYSISGIFRTIWEGVKFVAYICASTVINFVGAPKLKPFKFKNPWEAPVFKQSDDKTINESEEHDSHVDNLIKEVFPKDNEKVNESIAITLSKYNKDKTLKMSQDTIDKFEQDIKQILDNHKINADIEIVKSNNQYNLVVTDTTTNEKYLIKNMKIAPPINYKEEDYLNILKLQKEQNAFLNRLNMVISNISPSKTEIDGKINAIITLDILRKCSETLYSEKHERIRALPFDESFKLGTVTIPIRSGYQNFSINSINGKYNIADNDSKYIQNITPDKSGMISEKDQEMIFTNMIKEYDLYDTGSADVFIYSKNKQYDLNIYMNKDGNIHISDGKKDLIIEKDKTIDLGYVDHITKELGKLTSPKVLNIKAISVYLCTCANPNIDLTKGSDRGYPLTITTDNNLINITDISQNTPDITTCINNWPSVIRNCMENPNYLSDMADSIIEHNGKVLDEINLKEFYSNKSISHNEYHGYNHAQEILVNYASNEYQDYIKNKIEKEIKPDIEEEIITEEPEVYTASIQESEEIIINDNTNELEYDDEMSL